MRSRLSTSRAVLLALLIPLVARPGLAQRDGATHYALRVEPSTRMAALGGASAAGRDDDVLFTNPSQLVVARGTSVSWTQRGPGTRGGAGSSVIRFGSGGIALGVHYLELQLSEPVFQPGVAADAAPGDAVTSVAAMIGGAQLFKGFRIGATAKYVVEQVGGGRGGTAAFDAGVSRDFARFFTGGVAVRNIGRDIRLAGDRVELPMLATAGAQGSGPVGPLDLLLAASIDATIDGEVSPHGGAEASYSWLDGYSVALRAGARRPPVGENELTAGAGFTRDRVSLDYAIESLDDGRLAHRIGLRIR